MFVSSKQVLSHYLPLFTTKEFDFSKIGKELPLPKFSQLILFDLLQKTEEHLMSQKTLLKIPTDTIIVGDLHGSIGDLLRILHEKYTSSYNLLFLGDYVDRGSFSIDVITLLFALMLENPERVFLVRGNHEFRDANQKYGFYDEIMSEYNNEHLWERFNEVFDYLPIAALVGEKTFCVHGGLSPNLDQVDKIEKIERPIKDCSISLICDLMWSDPSNNTATYTANTRGRGTLFGCLAVKFFLDSNKPIERIIRAHQCVDQGILMSLNGTVYTVFSASNYPNANQNKSAIMYIDKEEKVFACNYDALPKISKENCVHMIVQSVQSYNSTFLPRKKGSVFQNHIMKGKSFFAKDSYHIQRVPISFLPKLV